MPFIDSIELIEQFPAGGSDRIGNADEFSVLTDMSLEVLQQFLGDIQADLRHVIFSEYSYDNTIGRHVA